MKENHRKILLGLSIMISLIIISQSMDGTVGEGVFDIEVIGGPVVSDNGGLTLERISQEEAVDLGGGLVLLFGCAAGDVGIAAVLEVR